MSAQAEHHQKKPRRAIKIVAAFVVFHVVATMLRMALGVQ